MRIEATELAGGAYQRGLEHGRRLKAEVRGHMAARLDSLAQAGLGRRGRRMPKACSGTPTSVRRSPAGPPTFWKRWTASPTALRSRADLIFAALQLLDEEWAYRGRRQAASVPLEKCSSPAVVTDSGPTWIGQNMDLGGYTDGR